MTRIAFITLFSAAWIFGMSTASAADITVPTADLVLVHETPVAADRNGERFDPSAAPPFRFRRFQFGPFRVGRLQFGRFHIGKSHFDRVHGS